MTEYQREIERIVLEQDFVRATKWLDDNSPLPNPYTKYLVAYFHEPTPEGKIAYYQGFYLDDIEGRTHNELKMMAQENATWMIDLMLQGFNKGPLAAASA